jgi:hypothetical protein
MKKLWRGPIAVAILLMAGITLTPQEKSQSQRVPQFDNNEVKVWRTIVMPNGPLAMHRHEHARVIIPIVGGTMKIVQQSGGSETHVWETGKAYWLTADPPNAMHADVNAGTKPIEVMVVELQRDK